MSKKAKVLIVDDDPLNRLVLEKTLKGEHDVFLVESGEKALTFVKTTQVDLIILDVVMPGIDGYEVLVQLKENPITQSIPIIFISANQSHEDESKGLELGAMDYIIKPFSASIVRVRVRNQLLIKQKNDLLEMLASIDGLTEIPNRRYLDENLSREWRRSKRGSTPLSVLLMDIDHFKRYNDCYGHRAGDECLKKVAQVLVAQCKRGGDFVARYGGEEFAAVLPGVNKHEAIQFANTLRNAVNALKIEHKASLNAEHITISIGVATTESGKVYAEQTLLEEADLGLYAAKDAGRNQIIAR
ncbi:MULTISPECIES: diguanylate cyclase [Pseudoalteromonas]|uniref:diguanylate cyclase n=1 Tax=Pseudoalteromonas fuliginea TaxID=1872678 RepID=A0ABD3YGG9_9GAMM|nr:MULTISPECIES: diguanylate cyclase [Pseudoalteromonas]ALQ07050.1 diguanylate cyclase response regulator [Pseudoalteromonas sp. Bsw20308]ATG78701.1 diguanylate cyclase [Pseudoalteromonas sp. 1_2015MBL_MicDiv]KAA1150300.1 diguanylate cyclase [Pseudoalteromonas fuliginea]KAA1165038.1 diguanylate cyclase [Pseudoalteromonas fuliginea]KDC53427.1 diguanylate cyclase [Pseudoalteromonas fuliginea]